MKNKLYDTIDILLLVALAMCIGGSIWLVVETVHLLERMYAITNIKLPFK